MIAVACIFAAAFVLSMAWLAWSLRAAVFMDDDQDALEE